LDIKGGTKGGLRILFLKIDKRYCVLLNPPESPFEPNNCIPKKSGVQRGTSPEQSWLTDWKKSNIEARPPLITKHKLKNPNKILKGELKGD
jgi:hypothetical protein